VIARPAKPRHVSTAIFALGCVAAFAFLVSGCADAYYPSMNASRAPEAKYNTYYGPYYYPYYPWYSYYGGAYYYGE
jgi:hypothetical protein